MTPTGVRPGSFPNSVVPSRSATPSSFSNVSTPASQICELSITDLDATPTLSDPTLASSAPTIADDGQSNPQRTEASRLPALFPRADTSPVDGPSDASSTLTFYKPLDLGPAPRGPSKSGWPWLYFCDMAAGFEAMDRFRRDDGMSTDAAFALAFPGHTRVRATLSQNRISFDKARKSPGVIQRWKSCR